MSLQINLAALTEHELLSLFGPQELQRQLPDISRARLEGRALPGPAVPAPLVGEVVGSDSGQLWGATPEQSRALGQLDNDLVALGAQPGAVYRLGSADLFAKAYSLGDVAISVQWDEGRGAAVGRDLRPRLRLLTWLRDRASGLACVLTTDAAVLAVPAASEEIDVHQHPDAAPAELLKLHQLYVQRLGRAQKLPEGGWLAAWQAAYDLNLAAWQRRGVVTAVEQPI